MLIQKTKMRQLFHNNGINGLAHGTIEEVDRQFTTALAGMIGRNNSSPKRLRPEDIDLFKNGVGTSKSPESQEGESPTMVYREAPEGECGRCSHLSNSAIYIGKVLDGLVDAGVTDRVRDELLKRGVL